MPPKKRACLTPLNQREIEQRQKNTNYVRAYRAGRQSALSRLACNAHQFDEKEVDGRLQTHSCGQFNVVCEHCNALRWREERTSFCCQNGKVSIPLPPAPPDEIKKYFDLTKSGKLFLPHSRLYNNALALASIGCNEHAQQGFNPTFTIQGKLYHRLGSLLPPAGNNPKFAQIFFHDSTTELTDRLSLSDSLNADVIKDFQDCLHTSNSYVQSFKSAVEVCAQDKDLRIILHAKKVPPKQGHTRTYNLPTSCEVAALLPGDNSGNLDIILRCRSGDGQELRRINTCHRSYDPLHYVLMFPTGCDGWRLGLTKSNNKTLTAADFYAFRLQVRLNDYNIIFKMQKLMQQYAVDQWAKIEASRLEWVRANQKSIRAEKYQGLMDAAASDDHVNVGMKIILPATVYGSPRFYSEAFQDAMAIVRQLGKPDIFITFTCNPKWPEITSALNPGEQPCDRPDLSCRVFKLKFTSLMNDILKKDILGSVKAHTATIEFQKRGLPHAHILLIIDKVHKPNQPAIIDGIVSAEIPDKDKNPQLHQIVTSQNIHGPCGNINRNSPCMNEGHCTKKFPKQFQDKTIVTESSYPLYMRRSPDNGGRTHKMKVRGSDICVDNSFIVPYNPTLSLRYHAHINVEIVHSVQAVKYLYKYITKGQDRVLMEIRTNDENDEISRYANARYISASEAFWRLYGFEIHSKHPPVEKLPCHLPNQQTILFQPNEIPQVVANGPPDTKLTAFLKINTEDPTARTILYPDFPHYFTWNQKQRKWQRRKRGVRNPENPEECKTDCIGRIPTISLSPHQAELYYLRLLLYHKPGATSFENLKSIDGIICTSYQDACNKLGLLDDDTEKDAAMQEASAIRFGPQLRLAFTTILIYCRPADPLAFWHKHKLELCRDIMIRDKVTELSPHIENQVLIELQHILDNDGLDLNKDFQMPPADYEGVQGGQPRIIYEELNFHYEELKEKVNREYPKLNEQQKELYDAVLESVVQKQGKVFALDASGGTGKTHTINLLLAAVRSLKKIALATALSGIAATLLANGRTLHSRCKVPLCINEQSMCSISPRDASGSLLRQTDLLVIDEVSMGHKYIFEAIDRSLQDIRDNDSLFGGMTVLMAGDWRQILPVVRHGSRPQIVNATLKSSYLWDHVRLFSLTMNMRVLLTGESAAFSDYLLSVGNGKQNVCRQIGEFSITLPEEITVNTEQDLLNFVFNNLNFNMDPEWLASRCIICPTNTEVDRINDIIMKCFPGEEKTYRSSDSVEENEHQYPTEFINSLCPSGMPPHKLTLRKNSIVMLLRNLDPTNGHCNGTRYIIQYLHQHVIDAVVACGPHAGKRIFIPRIPLIPSDNVFPFHMKRKQFPVRPAFAMTANKAQGQTLKKIGISLHRPFFSHGQLYVAMSRVGSRDSIRVHASKHDGQVWTNNVVYTEVLQ